MSTKSKVTEQTASGQAVDASEGVHPDDKGIRKKSKVPGVMITQFVEELPEGKTTPDFTRKPIALTIQEGKTAVFKAKVTGNPTPTITWSRANGEIHYHPNVCLQKFDEASHEHTLQFPKVSPEDADTYKCFASNEYGRAVCTVLLNVIAVGFSRSKEFQKTQEIVIADYRKKLKKRNADGTRGEKAMEPDEKVWEILLSADRKDYERICQEYGITDFRGMLRKLCEMKKEREEEIAGFVSQISALKHIDVKEDNSATIELDMDLKDPSSKIFLYKDGVMVPFTLEESETMKHSLKQVGKKYVFTIKNLVSDDAGLYSVDVEGVNVFSTDFKVPEIDFAVKIQEVKAMEREDALFQCVLTAPMNEIKWFGKNAPLSNSEKHEISASEDKLIHRLHVRDCLPLDAGIYAAVAGIKSCNAWLVVEADRDPANKGKKVARKTTVAGGGNNEDLMRIAKDQKEKHDNEMTEKMEIAKKAQAEKEAAEAAAQAEAQAAKKAAAEAKAAAKAAAKTATRSKRAADVKTGAAPKSKTKDVGAAAGGGSAADAAGSDEAGAHAKQGESKTAVGVGAQAAAGAKHDAEGGVGRGVGAKGEAEEAVVAGVEVKAGARAKEGGSKTAVGVGAQAAAGAKHDAEGGVGRGAGAKGEAEEAVVAGLEAKAGARAKEGGSKTAVGVGAQAAAGAKHDAEGGVGRGAGAKGEAEEAVVAGLEVKAGARAKERGNKTAVGVGAQAAAGAKQDAEGGVGRGAGAKGDAEEAVAAGVEVKAGAAAEGATGDNQEEDEYDSYEDSDIENEGQESDGGKEEEAGGGEKGKGDEDGRGDSLVPDTEIGDDNEGTTNDDEKSGKKGKRLRKKNLVVEEAVVDPGVHFHAGLSDCKVIIGEAAELECKVSSEDCKGMWYKDGAEINSDEGITISNEGSFHRLKIHKVTEEYAGKYKFEADGRKTEALIVVEDPPRFDAEELEAFQKTVTVKKGHKAIYKLPFIGREPIKVQWYLDGEELSDEANIKLEHSDGGSRLILAKLQRKDSGEIKIKLKNEFGTVEAFSQLVVLDKPTPPMGPLEIVDASSSVIEFKWRPPKDSGGCKIGNYILERQQIGRNTWKKVGPIGPEPVYRDTNVDHGRRYCYRIRAETEMGSSEMMETEDIQAGTKAYPGPSSAPKVLSAFKDCINLAWSPPANTGGTNILGYNLEKRKKGSNLWGPVNPPEEIIRGKGYAVKDVVEGMEYEFRVSAVNTSGAGEFSTPSEFVFARDPKKAPGKVQDFKVTDSTYTTLSLSWNKPNEREGMEDEAKGYFVEIRPAESTEWDRCNSNLITMTSYTVKGLKSMAMYWVRVVATNDGGEGEAQELDNYILAMPPPVRPRFTDAKIKSFMVVRAGNSARFNINFEASPWPDITWQKDGGPVSKKVTISNTEGQSQLLIPSAERTDSGIYTIIVKNIVGQEAFSIEIRVTDEPKPAGPVELDENVPGTVTISWTPSPDEKRDDRLHYMVTKRDSVKRQWHPIADRIFNNRFTACNIMPGWEYKFRVYAKNDMGSSKPSESPKWFIPSKKEKFTLTMTETKVCDLQCPPKFLVPLKLHAAPQGYECYMTCALKGDPMPHVTWLRNNVILNTNTNYYITNTCGVCSLLILRVGPKDTGEYKIVAENSMGRAECSTKLTVRE